MRVLIPAAFALATLFAAPLQSAATPDEAAIRAARTAADLQALGGIRLGAHGFAQRIVGHTLDEGRWTWVIRFDGTTSQAADDASWTFDGTWKMRQHHYCRAIRRGEQCSEVWMVGRFLRMTDRNEALADWTVEVK